MYAEIKENDIANGPGVRVSVFMQGCDLHCPGCHNSEIWDFNGGNPVDSDAIVKILNALEPEHVSGLSILGGEPLHPMNLKDTYEIIRAVRARYSVKKNIWLYTGYVFNPAITYMSVDEYNTYARSEEWIRDIKYLQESFIPADSEECMDTIRWILGDVDVLVDGPFIQSMYRPGIGFRGSTNQRIINMNASRCSSGKVYDIAEIDPINSEEYVFGVNPSKTDNKDLLKIRIKYFDKNMEKLQKVDGNKSDWIDLYTAEEVTLRAGDSYKIPLGVAMELPAGYEAIMAPRSGTFGKYGILQTNSIGVFDESFCGDTDQWIMSVYATRDTVIPKFARVAQFRLFKHQPAIKFNEVEVLSNTSRGGFGSTGI
ncbi:4Fe-4S cluster-binding domain-containing protein [Bacteroides acidifaciens]|uniref:4Fe-4S cluster-binding domain-containing protein n=1 Tax=Bacteroides acidifaciens TaxID=85831 RepID=UPI00263BAE85|nr:4Fe-4S cluster-binding domain-containing protein [Bacteroides acidifaciens]